MTTPDPAPRALNVWVNLTTQERQRLEYHWLMYNAHLMARYLYPDDDNLYAEGLINDRSGFVTITPLGIEAYTGSPDTPAAAVEIERLRAERDTHIDFVKHLHDGCEQRGLLTPDAEAKPYDRILFDALDERDKALEAIETLAAKGAQTELYEPLRRLWQQVEAIARGEKGETK